MSWWPSTGRPCRPRRSSRPRSRPGWFAEELAGEVTEPGFRCWTARDGGRLVGFAYGFPTPEITSDGWFGLVRAAVGDAAAEWLEGQIAVVWIAVHPEYRMNSR